MDMNAYVEPVRHSLIQTLSSLKDII